MWFIFARIASIFCTKTFSFSLFFFREGRGVGLSFPAPLSPCVYALNINRYWYKLSELCEDTFILATHIVCSIKNCLQSNALYQFHISWKLLQIIYIKFHKLLKLLRKTLWRTLFYHHWKHNTNTLILILCAPSKTFCNQMLYINFIFHKSFFN